MAQGINVGEVDGDFGPATQGAVKRLQERNDLDADGICGPLTLAKIDPIRGRGADDEPLTGEAPGIRNSRSFDDILGRLPDWISVSCFAPSTQRTLGLTSPFICLLRLTEGRLVPCS